MLVPYDVENRMCFKASAAPYASNQGNAQRVVLDTDVSCSAYIPLKLQTWKKSRCEGDIWVEATVPFQMSLILK